VIEDSLDSHCLTLLQEIKDILPDVTFIHSEKKDCYTCRIRKNDDGTHKCVEITYYEPIVCSKIAHELLHAKVGLIIGEGSAMLRIPAKCPLYEHLIQSGAIAQIVNACEHFIFYKEYRSMGYKDEGLFETLSVSEPFQMTFDSLLKTGIKRGSQYDTRRTYQYLSALFTTMLYPKRTRFRKEEAQLKKICFELYKTILLFRKEIEQIKTISSAYKSLMDSAYYNLGIHLNEWLYKAFRGV
jgi:hypothetical protein